jgi:hypothetical protein
VLLTKLNIEMGNMDGTEQQEAVADRWPKEPSVWRAITTPPLAEPLVEPTDLTIYAEPRAAILAPGQRAGGPEVGSDQLRGGDLGGAKSEEGHPKHSSHSWRRAAGLTQAAMFTTAGFARMIERAGEAAVLGFKAHAHIC